MFLSPAKSAVSFFLLFFLIVTAEASCFLKNQLYQMQRSSFEDIQTFLKTEGWKLRFQSTSEITSGFGFKKAVFTKSDVEKIAVYTSKSYGSIIQLELSNSCFKTISVSEFGQADRKLLVENDKSIKEYRNANQIIQLQEYDEGSATNSQILIFNEELKSKVYGIDQLFSASSANEPLNSGTSNSSSKTNLPNKDGIYEAVEVAPMPQGGMAGWNNYLAANLTYPTSARRMGIEGTVVVGFIVDTDGSISNIEILRGIGGGCDEEVIRIVKGAPRWTPGLQNGKAVRTFMRLPLSFKLGD